MVDIIKLKDLAVSYLQNNKAEKIISMDVIGKSDITSYMVIANAISSKHVAALIDGLSREIIALGLSVNIEGKLKGDWALLDAGEVIVHVFRPEVREIIKLEELWGK